VLCLAVVEETWIEIPGTGSASLGAASLGVKIFLYPGRSQVQWRVSRYSQGFSRVSGGVLW
jgi:hypothetical protein